MEPYILIWLFTSYVGKAEGYTGSARFDDLESCMIARNVIVGSRVRKHDICACFPAKKKDNK